MCISCNYLIDMQELVIGQPLHDFQVSPRNIVTGGMHQNPVLHVAIVSLPTQPIQVRMRARVRKRANMASVIIGRYHNPTGTSILSAD